MNEIILNKLAKPLLVFATVIWGSTFFILKDTLDNVSVYFMLAFRFTVAAFLLALVFWKHWKRIDGKYIAAGTLMGVLLFLAYTMQSFGLIGTTPGKNAFFTAIYCVIVPFINSLLNRTRPDKFNLIAALLCLAGIGFVSWDAGLSVSVGDMLTLIGGFLYACHIVSIAHFSKGRDIIILTVIQFVVVAVLSWISAVLTNGIPVSGLTNRAWIVLLYLAIAATALALLFQNVGQKYTDPSSAAVLLALEAPFGVFFSVLFANEQITIPMMIGFALIFISILCAETKFSFFSMKKCEKRVDKIEHR